MSETSNTNTQTGTNGDEQPVIKNFILSERDINSKLPLFSDSEGNKLHSSVREVGHLTAIQRVQKHRTNLMTNANTGDTIKISCKWFVTSGKTICVLPVGHRLATLRSLLAAFSDITGITSVSGMSISSEMLDVPGADYQQAKEAAKDTLAPFAEDFELLTLLAHNAVSLSSQGINSEFILIID